VSPGARKLWDRLAPAVWTLLFAAPALYVALYLVEAWFDVPLSTGQFRFERGYAIALLPAVVAAQVARGWLGRPRAPRLQHSRASELAAGPRGWRVTLGGVPAGLRAAALLLLVVALMGPQSIHARDRAEVQGIDMVLVLDASLSMQASDIAPNRFDATKAVVEDFVRRRPNDRIGAVIFGRDAFTLMPLTTDHQALSTAIDELRLGMIDGRGTAIGNAIGTGLNRLRRSDAKSKVLILLTDGDSNAGNVAPDQAAEFASAMGVKIYTVLMGQDGDAPVQQGVDLFGRPLWDRGNFPINPELLRTIASRTGGEAFRATDRRGLEQSFHAILDRLEKSEIEDTGRVYGELFPAALAPALVLLVLELLLATLVFRRLP
jgi:Ca-activated chloride channel family protein